MTLVMVAVFAVLLLLSFPVGYALVISSGAAVMTLGSVPTVIAVVKLFQPTQSFPLLAIPLFIFAGAIMNSAGISRRLIAFAYALKHHLQGTRDGQSGKYLSADDVKAVGESVNAPDRLLRLMSRDVAALSAAGRLDPMMVAQVEDNLTALAGVQAGCERIRHTPLPFSYSLLLHRTAYLYCFALPFGLAVVLALA